MGCLRFIITFQDTLFLNSKTEVIKAHLQPSGALQSSDALSPSITIQPSDIRKSFGITIPHMSITKELETEIEIELTKEFSFMRDRNPIMWNSALKEYCIMPLSRNLAMRFFDGLDVWHLDVVGPPSLDKGVQYAINYLTKHKLTWI
ncbi:unnamed protein product [Rhizophagus irregularis]|nr:unnamed protein product [Rhizophagus irregularis]CAB4418558.1 unnamed protein product [Rhizophagus irregularis]